MHLYGELLAANNDILTGTINCETVNLQFIGLQTYPQFITFVSISKKLI